MNVTDSLEGLEEDDQPVRFSESQTMLMILITSVLAFVLLLLCGIYSGYKHFKNAKTVQIEKEAVNIPKFNSWNSAQDNGNQSEKKRPSGDVHVEQSSVYDKTKTTITMPQKQQEPKISLKPERHVKRVYSVIIILFAYFFLLVVVNSFDRRNKYHLFAYLGAIFGTIWHILLFSILFTAEHLHAVRVRRKRLSNSQFLFVPYEYVDDKHRLIRSVSELVAISGSNVEGYWKMAWHITFAGVYCSVFCRWSEEESDEFTKLDVELLLFLIGNVGTLMVATWELEPHTFGIISHYLGAATCFVCNPMAFALQQNFSYFSIILMSVCYIGVVEWGILMFRLPRSHENLSMVHKLSKLSIINEALILFLINFAGFLFVFNL